MIDIVLDANSGNTFCGKEFPLVRLNKTKAASWSDYQHLAADFIKAHAKEEAAIISVNDADFSINKFSVALFAESVLTPSKLDYVVFKVSDLEAAREAYKPYLAITIAIKYVLRLVDDTPETIYRNLADLGYLGLEITHNYGNNNMTLSYNAGSAPAKEFDVDNAFDALVLAAVLKTISLAKIESSVTVKITLNDKPQKIDAKSLVRAIMQLVAVWIN